MEVVKNGVSVDPTALVYTYQCRKCGAIIRYCLDDTEEDNTNNIAARMITCSSCSHRDHAFLREARVTEVTQDGCYSFPYAVFLDPDSDLTAYEVLGLNRKYEPVLREITDDFISPNVPFFVTGTGNIIELVSPDSTKLKSKDLMNALKSVNYPTGDFLCLKFDSDEGIFVKFKGEIKIGDAFLPYNTKPIEHLEPMNYIKNDYIIVNTDYIKN